MDFFLGVFVVQSQAVVCCAYRGCCTTLGKHFRFRGGVGKLRRALKVSLSSLGRVFRCQMMSVVKVSHIGV